MKAKQIILIGFTAIFAFAGCNSTKKIIPANESIVQKSKNPNCKELSTGDYCFQNNTKLNLEVVLMSSPSKTMSYTAPFTCTLQPGQNQCFFDVPGGAAKYSIKTPATYSGYGSTVPVKEYKAEGSLYVETCQVKIFNIK